MKQLLLDTNIVVYLLNGDPNYIELLKKFESTTFLISIVTWIEALAGSLHHGKGIDELMEDINSIPRLYVNEKIGRIAAYLIQNNFRKKHSKKFPDIIIAATAISHDLPLFTNNPKNFRGFKGLKILSPRKR